MEDYIKEKKKKKMFKILLIVKDSLTQVDWLVESLEEIILRGEDDGINSEIFDMMSFEDKRKIWGMFEKVELKIKEIKKRIIMQNYRWRKPPLR